MDLQRPDLIPRPKRGCDRLVRPLRVEERQERDVHRQCALRRDAPTTADERSRREVVRVGPVAVGEHQSKDVVEDVVREVVGGRHVAVPGSLRLELEVEGGSSLEGA